MLGSRALRLGAPCLKSDGSAYSQAGLPVLLKDICQSTNAHPNFNAACDRVVIAKSGNRSSADRALTTSACIRCNHGLQAPDASKERKRETRSGRGRGCEAVLRLTWRESVCIPLPPSSFAPPLSHPSASPISSSASSSSSPCSIATHVLSAWFVTKLECLHTGHSKFQSTLTKGALSDETWPDSQSSTSKRG